MSLLLTFDNLKEAVDNKVFTAALEIYNINQIKIENVNIQTNMDFTTYKTNYNDPYTNLSHELEIIIEERKEKFYLEYYNCTCDKVLYNSICDHTTAFLLFIMNYFKISKVKQEKTIVNREQRLQNELIDLLNVDVEVKNVQLKPIFSLKNNKVSLKLKIGLEKFYLIQNISELLERIYDMNFFSYGKELEFTHSLDCFDETSQKLIDLLYLADQYSEGKSKELKLVPKLIYNIFLLYKDQEITFIYKDEEIDVLNNLVDRTISIEANTKFIELKDLNVLAHFTTINGVIGIDYNSTYLYRLNKHELKLFTTLDQNDNKLPINLVMEGFMTKVYPNVKNIVTITDELRKSFPDLELEIQTYFDLKDGIIVVTPKYFEENIEKIYSELSTMNKASVDKYVNTLERMNIYNFKITELNDIVEFLETNLDDIKKFGPVFIDSELNNLKPKATPKIVVKAKYNVNLIELDVESEYSSSELEKIMNAYKRKNKYVQLKDNTIIRIDEEVQEIINLVDDYNLDPSNLIDTHAKPESFIMKFFNDHNIEIDDKIEDILEELKDFKESMYEVPSSLKNILRSYQVEAFKWLKIISKHKFGAILADDMGLGKTLEILTVLLDDEEDRPSLIVTPTSLIYNWYSECAKWCSDINAVTISGDASTRENIISLITDKKTIYITSYDSLIRDIDFYKTKFRYVILDEAQYIKNHTTRKSKTTKLLNADIRLALTGTPVENSLADLWSIFDFIMPNYLSSYNAFKERYERLIMNHDKQSLLSLKDKITPFILRRTKKQVLTELPDKIEEVYYAELTGEQHKLYEAHINKIKNSVQNKSKVEILSMITRLRQICVAPSMFLEGFTEPEAKIDLTMELVNKAISGNHKVLIFSQFTKALDILKNNLDELDISNLILTGETKSKERIELVDDFNNDENIKVFLISLKAGGTGLNLVSADTVIHLDPWWNLSAEAQATDRAHRMGQKNNVTVIKIVCAKTIEERVLLLQEKKSKLAKSIIDDDDTTLSFDSDDLSFILE